jgi:hypothetical protein
MEAQGAINLSLLTERKYAEPFRTSGGRAAGSDPHHTSAVNPTIIATGEIKTFYGTNSLVSSAPPKLGSVALIFTTLCESLAIQSVCLLASSSAATDSTL